MNYGELKTAIQDYVQSSETTFTSHIDDFVRTAEERIYRLVQLPAFFESSAIGDIGSVTAITLPAGSIEVYGVRISKTAGDEDGEWTYLLKKDWDFLMEAYPGSAAAVSTGVPKYYAVGTDSVNASTNPAVTIEIAPKPDAATYKYIVDYYGKTAAQSITADGTDSNTTWLSVTFPDALLYGSLTDAYLFLKSEPQLLQYCEQRFNEAVGSISSIIADEQPSLSPAGQVAV
jgi:hypothetical protein